MRLLVLGGGGFLGHHVAAAGVAAGHAVTTFSRGGDSAVPGVEALAGDRGGDLAPLRGRTWEAVLDTFSEPEAVARTAELLSPAAGTYGYVSGISVYHPDGPDVVSETARLRAPGDPPGDADPLQARSEAKLACERAVRDGFAGRALIVRPGIMVGPRDPTDRFTHWAVRLASPDPAVAPGDPHRPVQYTDARDLAGWIVASLARGLGGTFNAVGPGREEALEAVLRACGARDGVLRWVGEEVLRERLASAGVEEEARPLWFPEDQIPFARVDCSRAEAEGLRFRPAAETARDTLAWRRGQPGPLRAGLPPALERALLA